MGLGSGWGVPPTHVHMHAHGNFMQMAAPIGFGEIPGIPYDVIRVCMHMHMRASACMCTWVGYTHLPPPPPSTHPHPPGGRTPGIIQNSIALELIEIFQFCLKI